MPADPRRGPDRDITRRQLLGGVGAVALAGSIAGRAGSAVAATGQDGLTGSAESTGVGIVVRNETVGHGMPLVGYNTGHYLPGSNTSGWLEYSRVNAVRFFASFTEWTPDEAFDAGDGITDVAGFDERKAELRRDPEHNPFLSWDILEDVFENHVYSNTNFYRLNYQVSELRRLGVTPIMEAAELRWNTPWSVLWLEWQKHYAFTYHLARHYDVHRYNFVNEPDHPSAAGDLVDQAVYVRGLQIASDAIKSAVADVNSRYHKRLEAIVQAPVITHASSSTGNDHMDADTDTDHRDDTFGWGQISLMNLRTDYHGRSIDNDVFDVFDTHQYNKTAETYTYEIGMMNQRMRQYTPTGVDLPIVYSEFNRRNTSAFETSGDDLDTPLIYCDLAQIWGATLTGGVEGMIAFKFQNTMRANGIPYGTGFYYVDHADGVHDIHGVSKAGEVNRLFAKGFKGRGRPTLRATADDGRIVPVSHDEHARCYYLWLPHPTGSPESSVSLDLSDLPLPEQGGWVSVEEVGPAHGGGIVSIQPLPASKQLTLVQPADSVWLLTVAAPAEVLSYDAVAGVTVGRDGDGVDEATLAVALDSSGTGPTEVSYLAFDIGDEEAEDVRHARLDLHGASDDGQPYTFLVYALTDTAWTQHRFDWASAPYLDPDVVHPTDVGTLVFPAGQVSALGSSGPARLDVTDAVRHARGASVGFLLIREQSRAEDVADNGRRATFASPRADDRGSRPRLVLSL